jgi:hypothetical protein
VAITGYCADLSQAKNEINGQRLLMTSLEHLKIWSLDGRFALFPFAVVPPTDLARNIGLVSADLRLWESRSDFQANYCWRRRL